jgi:hypothetical protein
LIENHFADSHLIDTSDIDEILFSYKHRTFGQPMALDQVLVGQMSVDQMSVDQMPVSQMLVYQM